MADVHACLVPCSCASAAVWTDASFHVQDVETLAPLFDVSGWPKHCLPSGRTCITQIDDKVRLRSLTQSVEKEHGFNFKALTPERLLTKIANRTLWLVGDAQVWSATAHQSQNSRVR